MTSLQERTKPQLIAQTYQTTFVAWCKHNYKLNSFSTNVNTSTISVYISKWSCANKVQLFFSKMGDVHVYILFHPFSYNLTQNGTSITFAFTQFVEQMNWHEVLKLTSTMITQIVCYALCQTLKSISVPQRMCMQWHFLTSLANLVFVLSTNDIQGLAKPN